MIELPEAQTVAGQIAESLSGRRVVDVVANHSPHKFAWFLGDPATYAGLLCGHRIVGASAYGSFVDVDLGAARLLLAEGTAPRLHEPGTRRPAKHQLLLELDDGSALSGSVQMYGSLIAFAAGDAYDNRYGALAQAAPSPLTEAFDAAHFASLLDQPGVEKLSVKAFLATEQRIPGLGNGVLQDILFAAGMHPRRPVASLGADERAALHSAIRGTLQEMTRLGGRDTEKDLYGRPGGYATKLSRLTVGRPCSRCGTTIEKAPYLGGSIYFCRSCQKA